jgi:hypothetical protein
MAEAENNDSDLTVLINGYECRLKGASWTIDDDGWLIVHPRPRHNRSGRQGPSPVRGHRPPHRRAPVTAVPAEAITAAAPESSRWVVEIEGGPGICPNAAHLLRIESGRYSAQVISAMRRVADALDAARPAAERDSDLAAGPEPDPRDARIAELEQLAADILGAFSKRSDGWRARAAAVQIAKWQGRLGRRAVTGQRVMTMRLGADMAKDLATVAAVDGKPVSQIVRQAVADHITARKADPAFGEALAAHIATARRLLGGQQ